MGKDLNKPGERAVIGLLYLWRKDTGGEFIKLKVILDALAAFALSGARLIGAVAPGFIDVNLAVHWLLS